MGAAAAQTSTHPVLQFFVAPLRGTFSRTPGASDKEYFADLCTRLSGFDERILRGASDRVFRKAASQTWPLPPKCVEACEETARETYTRTKRDRVLNKAAVGLPEDAAVRILVAEDMNLGLRACNGDWQGDLIDFIKRNHRMPDVCECEGLIVAAIARSQRLHKQEQAALNGLFGRDVSGRVLPDNHPVKIMLNAFTARRERFATMIAQNVLKTDTNEGAHHV
ncbi:hypothetical protein [Pseudovibrio sp. Tun.PSC04-5.I4]|uniref:hypothetical protein n=1 Tax=Pseudovibrio sp. Tun.PSC04-5.I4 TaxID=1798213 RepID=UPI000886AF76|nr:hypothetical protein [Pseudovibrio sp. Tun.PSC04-5.I4]SDQ99417.1 hypothetical protein SAMN04515695_2221 [Pseudovibrio sp. Tun.PSC04-5.I4]